MTPCQRLKERLFDLLDADADSADKRNLEGHLKTCPHCSELLLRMKRQKETLRRLASLQTQDHFIVLLRDRIRREIAGKLPSRSTSLWMGWRSSSVFASVILVLAAMLWFSDTRNRANPAVSPGSMVAPVSSASVIPPSSTVHYVIDELPDSPEKKQAAVLPEDVPGKSDTVQSSADSFDELRSRLTPVSF